ncbi:MAG: ABC transporter permease [Candidatus Bathyarchaeota archaeon]|nr:ABC transporter permease [Candidatus Bathyarchaeota archaeon]
MAVKGFIKFIAKRTITVFLVIVVALYFTILIANMGGFVDEIVKNNLQMEIAMKYLGPQWQGYDPAELERLMLQEYELAIRIRGLDQPFLIRSVIYLKNALLLDLGRSEYLTSDTGSRYVRNIILERLPATVMLFTTANVLNFLITMFIGLYLSRHHGGKLDKLFIGLTPTSVIPGWFYGIFLILLFASQLHILPYGGLVDVPPPTDPMLRALSTLKHMILPLASWIISMFFLGCYSNRTFFLIFSTEDYVEAARAKGVPPRQIETKYILRPSLPPIITSFALGLINSWGGAIITERVFNWPGLGTITYTAINLFDSAVLIGVTIIYAYLLGATVLILDILYGFIDPRIKAKYGR